MALNPLSISAGNQPVVIEDHAVIVTFAMWGQYCTTRCETLDEALRWLDTCARKGWLLALAIATEDGVVLHDRDALGEMVDL